MPWFQLKMHQNAFGSRAMPGPARGAHSAPPDPLAGFKGSYFLGEMRGGNAPNFVSPFGGIEAPVEGIPCRPPKLHPSPCSSVGMRPRRHTDTDALDHNTFRVVHDSREM